MATQDWQSPYSLASDPNPVPSTPRSRPGYDLRPLSVGEILDRVFSLYRSHFWLLAGFSAASAGVNAGLGILRLIYMHFAHISVTSPSHVLLMAAFSILQGVLYLIAYSLTLAATTFAVNTFYLGHTTSFEVALKVARQIWLRCMGISIWQTWSAMWAFLVLLIPIVLIPALLKGSVGAIVIALVLFVGIVAGVVYGVIAYLRNSLALPAAVVEGLHVRDAMRRSKNLATGSIGRIFLLLLLVYALWMVATVIQLPLVFLATRAGAAQQFVMQGAILAINFVVTTVVAPIAAIGLCLFYFDERVRKEGFDIEMLLHGATVCLPPATLFVEPIAGASEPAADPHPAAEQI